ncbi:hypothetical protein HK096_000716, partial [Nowakowskiella sp. JEL0078]
MLFIYQNYLDKFLASKHEVSIQSTPDHSRFTTDNTLTSRSARLSFGKRLLVSDKPSKAKIFPAYNLDMSESTEFHD